MRNFIFNLLILSGLTLSAQLEGNFNTDELVFFSNKQFENLVSLERSGDSSFIACVDSYDISGNEFSHDASILKLNTTGILESEFADSGWLYIPKEDFNQLIPKSIHLDEEGNIFVLSAGITKSENGINTQQSSITKLLPNGAIDNTFGNSGTFNYVSQIGYSNIPIDFILHNQFIYIIGEDINPDEVFDPFPILIKTSINGTLDENFGNSGELVLETISSDDIPTNDPSGKLRHIAGGSFNTISINENEKIIVSGKIADLSETHNFIASINQNGTFNNSFHSNGYLFTETEGISNYSDFIDAVELPDLSLILSYSSSSSPHDVNYVHLKNDRITSYSFDINSEENETSELLLTQNERLLILNNNTPTNDYSSISIPQNSSVSELYIDNLSTAKSLHLNIATDLREKTAKSMVDVGDWLISGGDVISSGKFKVFFTRTALGLVSTKKPTLVEETFLYPTITSDILTINSNTTQEEYSVSDVSGNTSYLKPVNNNLDVSHLQKGLYFLKTDSGAIYKFIKQ